jgi:hypothetical protein
MIAIGIRQSIDADSDGRNLRLSGQSERNGEQGSGEGQS